MSAAEVYQRNRRMIAQTADRRVDESSLDRLALYVSGTIEAHNGSPAQAAKGVVRMQLRSAQAASVARQMRRMENDPEITAEYCFHPLARQRLLWGRPARLTLIVDPTLQEDRVVMISVNVWYRGRSLPLVWTIYPANQPLEGASFWERVAGLLAQAAKLLPARVAVTVVADRAFGTPAFTDLVTAHGWDWIVRVQSQTLYRDRGGHEGQVGQLVRFLGQRRKLRGQAFKKAGWRAASIVVYWGERHKKPVCLVSSLPPGYYLLAGYRQRFPIEGTFRDYKAYGWRWEQGQVTDLQHLEHLLVGMAIATWIALLVGTWRAAQLLALPPTGHRRTLPDEGKSSLFTLGLDTLRGWLYAPDSPPDMPGLLSDWEAPTWSRQLYAHHAHAFVFADHPASAVV